jgi:hypothetical protein
LTNTHDTRERRSRDDMTDETAQRYVALRNVLDEQNPDKYTVMLRTGIGAVAQFAISHALLELGVKHRYTMSDPEQTIWTTPEDAERAEMIARRVEEHSKTWEHVLRLAVLMEHKFSLNRHKGDRDGWLALQPLSLLDKLENEEVELSEAVMQWRACPCREHAVAVAKEAADVANYCVELADRVGGL